MKSARTQPVWGPNKSATKLPDVESARQAAVDDPRTPYHGTVQSGRVEPKDGQIGFDYSYNRGERYSATVYVNDTGERREFAAHTAGELNRKISQENEALLRARYQGNVILNPVETVWRATLVFDDGHSEAAEGGTEKELLV